MAKKSFSLKRRLQHMTKRQKIRFALNSILVFMCLVCVVVFIIAKGAFDRLDKALNEVEYEDKTKSLDLENDLPEDHEKDGYWNILILGLDSRAADGVNDNSATNYGDKRSDCIILVSMNVETKEVKLVSVYRDTVLKMRDIDYYTTGEYCYSKATHAYSWGSANVLDSGYDAGPSYTIEMLQTNLDLVIDDYVIVNFGVVADVIDALGGVTITLDSAEVGVINPYIQEINDITGSNSAYIYSEGTYNLDGTQATAYGRIRYTVGDDYKRTERQRDVLMLAADKAKKAGIDKLFEIVEIVAPHIRTSLEPADLEELITKYALNFKIDKENGSKGFPFEKSTKAGDSYVYPVDLETNVIELHKYLFGDNNYEPSVAVKNISAYISDMFNYGYSNGEGDGQTWYSPEEELPEYSVNPTEEPQYTDEPEYTDEPVYTEEPEYTEEPTYTTQSPVSTPQATEKPEETEIVLPTEVPTTEPTPEPTPEPVPTADTSGGDSSSEVTDVTLPQ